MSFNAGSFVPVYMSVSGTVITPLAVTTGIKFEVAPGFPCVVNGFGCSVAVAIAAADPFTITLSRRPVAGIDATEYALGTCTVAGGSIAGDVWLNEVIAPSVAGAAPVITSGMLTPYINYGESLVFEVTAGSASGSWLPILSLSPFRSGTTATGTGVAKKVITTNAAGTINHVVA